MMEETLTKKPVVRKPKKGKRQPMTWSLIKNQRQLIWMSVPLLAYIILFSYVPIWGWTMAFQDYKLGPRFCGSKMGRIQAFQVFVSG